MLNEDRPVVRLQDWEIERLLMERKKVTPNMLGRLAQLRPRGVGHLTQDCEIVGEEGSVFQIILRQTTARYQARGFDEDAYAEASDHFTDLHSALQCLFADCGCDLPPDTQIPLFTGGQS